MAEFPQLYSPPYTPEYNLWPRQRIRYTASCHINSEGELCYFVERALGVRWGRVQQCITSIAFRVSLVSGSRRSQIVHTDYYHPDNSYGEFVEETDTI